MRRNEIIESFKKIQAAVENSAIYGTLSDFLTPESSNPAPLLQSLKVFTFYYESSTIFEKEIINIFNLKGLTDTETWSLIFSKTKNEKIESLYSFRRNLLYIKELIPKMIVLLTQDFQVLNYKKDFVKDFGQDVMTVILPEEENKFSNPIRLSELLNSIILIYQTFAIINNKSQDDISVVSMDSGSDKSFDFLGNAEVIKCIKEFFIELWDRVVFFRERLLHERLELISKSLPIIEKISILEQNGSIGREQAEILRRNIIESSNKLISTGAIIPEIEKHSSFNVRQLMAPEPKMLKEGSKEPEDKEKAEREGKDISKLSEEEQEQLKNLLNKIKE